MDNRELLGSGLLYPCEELDNPEDARAYCQRKFPPMLEKHLCLSYNDLSTSCNHLNERLAKLNQEVVVAEKDKDYILETLRTLKGENNLVIIKM